MTAEFDLVIRNGTVADGTGRALREADIGVKDGRIAALGDVTGRGADEIDARHWVGRIRALLRPWCDNGDHGELWRWLCALPPARP